MLPDHRELWYRASLAWRSVLQTAAAPAPAASTAPAPASHASASATPTFHTSAAPSTPGSSFGPGFPSASPLPFRSAPADPRVALVVSHNNCNQALLATAMGLPPSFFRRLPHSNAALSVFDFEPAPAPVGGRGKGAPADRPPRVTLSCYNQSPDSPFKNPDQVSARVALVTPPTTTEGGPRAEAALAALSRQLGGMRISLVLAAPGVSDATVRALLEHQEPTAAPQRQESEPTPAQPATPSQPAGAQAAAAGGRGPGEQQVLPVETHIATTNGGGAAMWERAVALCAASGAGGGAATATRLYGNVLVVLDERSHEGAVWAALGLTAPHPDGDGDVDCSGDAGPRLRVSAGGLSLVEFPAGADPRVTPAAVRCINSTAHWEAAEAEATEGAAC
ncbi:hypothetical protein GPECTOR_45g184 [Gonium pectorale]|uniref:Uncharacterized protein n=1 Tax=Gonium pectorale TaxID=33097 RepID=A0A150G8Z9_GONPE|nr:hypothetical protein GPECTOR_45g184 [Gonium pectorale]|eukprot:KXZ46314.1 hypothetical protein GPECTOR_45g184 [Gonium pectorale]